MRMQSNQANLQRIRYFLRDSLKRVTLTLLHLSNADRQIGWWAGTVQLIAVRFLHQNRFGLVALFDTMANESGSVQVDLNDNCTRRNHSWHFLGKS